MRKLVTVILCLYASILSLHAQNRTITGTVTDDMGKPLVGASILVKGTNTGTLSKGDGTFLITASSTATLLVVSGINFTTKEIKIDKNNSTINVSLKSSNDNLDEVVVVGYQTVKKKDLTGAIAVIGGAEIAQKPIANFTQLLQGKTAGLQVIGQSGQPGQNGYIRLRGTGSINASSEPLIMVDGIAVTNFAFGMINPNDIENVTVLKDASAAAIYGARAGNGVLVVTTKKGKSGKPQLRYSFQRGFSEMQPLANLTLMNSQEKLQYEFDAGIVNPIMDSMIRNRITAGQFLVGTTLFNMEAGARRNLWNIAESRGAGDWSKYYLQNGKTVQHEMSLSGASDKIKYYMSINKFDEDGILYSSFRNRLGGRLNVEYQALDWFKTGINIAATHTREYQNRELNNVQSPIRGLFTTNPYEPVYLPNGKYNLTFQGFSPLEGADFNTNFRDRVAAFTTVFAEAKLASKITAKTQVSLNYNTLKTENYLQGGSNLAGILGYNEKTDGGNQDFQYVVTNTLNWNQIFSSIHSINFLVGQEYTKRNFYSYSLSGRGMPTPSVSTVDNASLPQTVTSSKTQWSIVSYFANAAYELNKKYSISLSGRRDGSSRFGANNRFANFWAVGASWNIGKEKFMQQLNFISDLKLRSSLGTAGNVPDELYGSLGVYALNARYNNLPAATPFQLPNPDLTWEKNRNYDIGLDFGFFNNRITGSFDYYNRKTNDLLYPKNVSLTSGFRSVLSNVGSVQNQGYEFALSADIMRKKEFTWNISFNYTNNQNRVTELISDNVPSTSFTRLVIGQPLNTYFLVKWAGINPANGKNQYYKADGTITETHSLNDQVLLKDKSPLAKYFGSVSTSVSYRNFDLSLQFYYSGGNYIYNQMYQNGVGDGGNANSILTSQFTEASNYWRKAGDQTRFPSLTDASQKVNLSSDKILEKGDYISLRDVVVGYNLDANIAKRLKLGGLRFYVQATNLWLSTKFHGLPEVGFSNREQFEAAAPNFSQPGQLSLYSYPPTRAITVGLDIKF